MKKLWPFLLIFLILPFFFKKDRIEHFEHVKPAVLAPIASHPWIALQTTSEIVPEMVRDLEKVDAYVAESRDDALPILIRTLIALQAEVPFHFPEELYNVLYITAPPKKGYPYYRIIKRVYFGDTHLGMPMYLDVRVFDADKSELSKIVDWHFQTIKGEFTPCGEGFIGTGAYVDEDSSHGFAKDRALFIFPHMIHDRLFVLYSDVPIENENALRDIAERCYREET